MSYLKELRKPSKIETDTRRLMVDFLDYTYFGTSASFLADGLVLTTGLTHIPSILGERTNFYYQSKGDFGLGSLVPYECLFEPV